jgi:all-trans-retinol 13,14-reductase
VLEKGRAIGVKLTTGEVLLAPAIVSAIGIGSTVRRLLPVQMQSREWARQLSTLPAGPAHVCLYLGLRGEIREAGASPANEWYYQMSDIEQAHWEIARDQPLPDAPVLYASFPTLKDPTYDPGPEVRHTGEVTTFVPWSSFTPWEGSRWLRRGSDYDDFKKRLTDSLLAQYLRHKPALAPFIDRVELSTPLSTDFFTRAPEGSVYGMAAVPGRFQNKWVRPRSPVPGLFFAGSDVVSPGIAGAMAGGMLAAAAIAPRASLPYLSKHGL